MVHRGNTDSKAKHIAGEESVPAGFFFSCRILYTTVRSPNVTVYATGHHSLDDLTLEKNIIDLHFSDAINLAQNSNN